jgi:hypothetical protein
VQKTEFVKLEKSEPGMMDDVIIFDHSSIYIDTLQGTQLKTNPNSPSRADNFYLFQLF